jgi:hypothetical protein
VDRLRQLVGVRGDDCARLDRAIGALPGFPQAGKSERLVIAAMEVAKTALFIPNAPILALRRALPSAGFDKGP